MFEIEIYLKNEAVLKRNNQYVVEYLRDQARDSIINESGSPKLGGNSQDKICAAMLLNGTFGSVSKEFRNEEFKERDDFYYCEDCLKKKEACVDTNKECLSWIGFRDQKTGIKNGYIKKYFYMWKGEKLADLREGFFIHPQENVYRFKIIVVDNDENFEKIRKKGIIRVVNFKDKNMEFLNAYIMWLNNFLTQKERSIQITKGSQPINNMIVTNEKVEYKSATVTGYENIVQNPHIICCSHGLKIDNNELEIRSHGSLAEKIFEQHPDSFVCGFEDSETGVCSGPLKKEMACELIETCLTNVAIFDNRLSGRFKNKILPERIETIQDQLNILFSFEEKEDFDKIEMKDINFLIMHLSFIEDMGFKENRINDFIRDQILSKFEKGHIPDNFFIVVTTGRGRAAWWENLEEKYRKFVIFRPIEALLSALEDALILKDDFQIKYNICNVIMGS